jgi:hypothetical protein
MKVPVALVSLAAALLGSLLFLSGFAGLLIDYLPTAPPDAVAAAHARAHLNIFLGVPVMLISAFTAGRTMRVAPKLGAASLAILAVASAIPVYLWLTA